MKKGQQMAKKTKLQISKTMKKRCSGVNHNQYGQHRSLETRRRISKALKNTIPWNKGIWQSKETIAKCRRASKLLWRKKSFRSKMKGHLVRLSKIHVKAPNKKEIFLNKLLKEWLPNEYKYVGNKKIFIGRKNPDFININGQKKIIELVGEHWHDKSYETIRPSVFMKYGYQTLIIWCRELRNSNLERLKNKTLKFNNLRKKAV